ncbi:MAG: hypothetical protein DRJ60_01150 [Thermoprotei archaeon]|nr:MAG: hypothetical protein DRJ60_01150 [Thermoprotei archaeon]
MSEEKIWERLNEHDRRITTLEASLRGAIREEITNALNPLVKITQNHEKRLALLEQSDPPRRNSMFSDPGRFWKYVIIALLFIIAALVGARLPGLALMVVPGAIGFLLTSATKGDTLTSGTLEKSTPYTVPEPSAESPGGDGERGPHLLTLHPAQYSELPTTTLEVSEDSRPTRRNILKTAFSTFRELHGFHVGFLFALLTLIAILSPGWWMVLLIPMTIAAVAVYAGDIHYFLTSYTVTLLVGAYLLGVIP